MNCSNLMDEVEEIWKKRGNTARILKHEQMVFLRCEKPGR